MSTLKLCKDCKHYIPAIRIRFGAGCMAKYQEDLVTGCRTYASANLLRESTDVAGCGQDAKLFEPKPPTKWQRLVEFLTSTEHK
jgi:hypothetical protein